MLPKCRLLPSGRKMILFGLMALLTMTLNTTPCQADAGDLDPAFGDGGTVITDFGSVSSDEITHAVLQDDEKLLVALNHYGLFVGDSLALIRLNPDGSLDETFGDAGVVVIRLIDNDGFYINGYMGGIKILSDGKILIGGSGYNYRNGTRIFYCALIRLHSDGSLDSEFGHEGIALTDFGEASTDIRDITVQEDGRIFAAGQIDRRFAVARFYPEGSLDETFGNQGLVTFDPPFSGSQSAEKVLLQPDGKIIAAGGSAGSSSPGLIVRFNPDGSLDESFGTDGIVAEYWLRDINYAVLQADGRIIVDFFRFNTDGTLDPSFTLERGATSPYDLVIAKDGKFVTAGYTFNPFPRNIFSLSRYNSDGSVDRTFGNEGTVQTPFEYQDGDTQARKVLVRKDGTIVALGDIWINWIQDPDRPEDNVGEGTIYGGDDTAKYLAIAQYDRYGSLDSKFSDDGKLTINLGAPSDDWVNDAIATQPDGKIIVAGPVRGPYAMNFGLIRYNTDGSLDDTFGDGGKVITDFRYYREDPDLNRFRSYEWIDALAIHSDGKIVAAGTMWPDYYGGTHEPGVTPTAYAVARYNPDGSLDSTFGNHGRVITEIGGARPYGKVNDVLIQPNDQKIVVVGYAEVDPDPRYPTRKFFLVRYNYDGSLDNTFGSDGIVITDFDPGTHEFATSAVIQADGKLIVGGFTYSLYTPQLSDFALVRYNEDGSIDGSFGDGGKVRTEFGEDDRYDTLYTLMLQPDGRIVAAGGTSQYPEYPEYAALARYKPDGSLDESFGIGGKVITQFSEYSNIWDCELQYDGKIVVVGVAAYFPPDPKFNRPVEDFAVARLNQDGSLDLSFGDGGIVSTNINTFYFDGVGDDVPFEQATAVSIQGDGKIVAAGWTKTFTTIEPSGTGFLLYGHWDIALARYEAFGAINIDGCDTGVTDQLYMGKSITDWINECTDTAKNHGKFVSCVAHLTSDLKRAGFITGSEEGAIQSCAGQAGMP